MRFRTNSIDKVTTSLHLITQPFITQTINGAVATAGTQLEKEVIKPLQKQNETLRGQLKKKEKRWNQQINYVLNTLSVKLNDLGQYGWRTSIRLFNVPVHILKSCDETIVTVINELLKVPISVDDIKRSHRLGQSNDKGVCPIILKFKT